jgi:hypothetical protein
MKALCLFIALLLITSCGENCAELPNVFSDYKEAIEKVESSNFALIDKTDCSESSWIQTASFYSCDKNVGFLIYSTDSKKYIHCDVPIHLWEGFKVAKSKGTFYNQQLKNRFRCETK